MSTTSDAILRAEQIQERLLNHLPAQLRDWSEKFSLPQRGGLLSGPRGVGKTTCMLSRVEQNHLLYLSADHPVLTGIPLFDLIEAVFMKGYDGIFVDEVHYAPDWARHLKAAYDAFPGHRVLAGGSSTIALHSKISDLSRRFPIHTMPLLSFREYLMLVLNKEIEPVNPFDAPKKQIRTLARATNILRHFNHYMAGGFRPFFLEEQELYLEKVMNTVAKTMEADIPFLVPSLTEQHLRLMHAVIGYLAVSNVPTLQINSLCREWSIGKEKLYQLLNAMERAHLIQIVRKRNDTKMNSVGAKLLLQEPSIYSFFGRNTGTRREAYVVRALSDAGHSVYASANETDCDFIAGDRRIEVGGASKNIKAADFVIRDNLDLPSGNSLPLWLPGLGY